MNFLSKRVEDVKTGKKKSLFGYGTPKTYTAGVNLKKDILDNKIKLIKTNRGGKITLHSPGQTIIYFVINLNKKKKI